MVPLIEKNCRLLGIPVTIFDSPIFDSVYHIEKSPCYLCARMRRGYLYSRALLYLPAQILQFTAKP